MRLPFYVAGFLAAVALGAMNAKAAKIPTGYKVQGCARYELTPQNRVRQICNDLEISQLRKDMANRVGRFEPMGGDGPSGSDGDDPK